MTTRVDLKGWFIVTDNGDETVVRVIEGVLEHQPSKVVARDPVSKGTRLISLESWSIDLYAPEDRAAADARAAKLVAEAKALDAKEAEAAAAATDEAA